MLSFASLGSRSRCRCRERVRWWCVELRAGVCKIVVVVVDDGIMPLLLSEVRLRFDLPCLVRVDGAVVEWS